MQKPRPGSSSAGDETRVCCLLSSQLMSWQQTSDGYVRNRDGVPSCFLLSPKRQLHCYCSTNTSFDLQLLTDLTDMLVQQRNGTAPEIIAEFVVDDLAAAQID